MAPLVKYLPVTEGNDLRLYVDGKEYFADLYKALVTARNHVFLTGLHFMANFELVRGPATRPGSTTLARVLADLGERGVEVFLLVNQFWRDEQEIFEKTGWRKAPVRRAIGELGGLGAYLGATWDLFRALAPYASIHCRTDIHTNHYLFGTNHQKTVVIDDTTAFLGGIDLTLLDGDRWDTPAHRLVDRDAWRTENFWHDVHLRVGGSAVEFVHDNFVQRWMYGDLHRLTQESRADRPIGVITAESDTKRPPLPDFPASKKQKKFRYPTDADTADNSLVQIVRSMPSYFERAGSDVRDQFWKQRKPAWYSLERGGSAGWEHSCKDAYLLGIAAARRYIYLENQWVSDEHIWAALADAARTNRNNPNFRIVIMLPLNALTAAGYGANQEIDISDEIAEVIRSSSDSGTLGMYSPIRVLSNAELAKLPRFGPEIAKLRRQVGHSRERPVYVHSKILIVDDEWSLIGSANAGGTSLEGIRTGRVNPDTELSAIIYDKTFAARFRKKLWDEHLHRRVADKYEPGDADYFRLLAGRRGSGIRFFPVYDQARYEMQPSVQAARVAAAFDREQAVPNFPAPSDTLLLSRVLSGLQRAYSRITASFPDELRWALPVAREPFLFSVAVFPPPLPGFRCWYRWRAELFFLGETKADRTLRMTKPFFMRGARESDDDTRGYSLHQTAHISKSSADLIERMIGDEGAADGRITCRVQMTSLGDSPHSPGSPYPSFLLTYDCKFITRSDRRLTAEW